MEILCPFAKNFFANFLLYPSIFFAKKLANRLPQILVLLPSFCCLKIISSLQNAYFKIFMENNTLTPSSASKVKPSTSLQTIASNLLISKLRNGVWIFGIHSWLFGVTDRGLAIVADGLISASEVLQLCTAFFLFISWLTLKPESLLNQPGDAEAIRPNTDLATLSPQEYLEATRLRMQQLQKYHLIRQEYVLPFPYLSQIYHLLNLKHLETIHDFSLNNLKVIAVNEFKPTAVGGMLKFQTVLESSMNALRIWRQPVVEVDLILHTPYTVELNIPVYNDRRMMVIFNVQPLNESEHKFWIDIYSNLDFPRPFLQILLHCASCLTLFEDLPYLRQLSEQNIQRLFQPQKVSERATMSLLKRFVELYGPSSDRSHTIAGTTFAGTTKGLLASNPE